MTNYYLSMKSSQWNELEQKRDETGFPYTMGEYFLTLAFPEKYGIKKKKVKL